MKKNNLLLIIIIIINIGISSVYNVGDNNMNYSKADICNMIAERTGAFIHFEEIGSDADQRNYIVSYEKIQKLGYKTTIGLEDGIDEVIKALKVIDIQNPYVNVTRIIK